MITCKICNKEFAVERGLISHLKAHKLSVADYHYKFFPRKSIATGEQIVYEGMEQYHSALFNSRAEMRRWFENPKTSPMLASRIARKLLTEYLARKEINVVPPDFVLMSIACPTLGVFKRVFSDFENEFDLTFDITPPPKIKLSPSFFIDTREQKPFEFSNAIHTKLEIGDYAAQGDFFDNVYVDRKNPQDFVGTFSANIDRFKRELKRSIEHDAFLYVVVEADMEKLYKDNLAFSSTNTLRYALKNAREIALQYPDHIQFILAGDRPRAAACTAYVLSAGKAGIKYDYQYLVNNKLEPWK